MSFTIYYKGTLKENNSINDIFDIVSNHIKYINAELNRYDDTIIINFLQGKNEPLTFHFDKNKINSFCKWNNPENPKEVYKIFVDSLVERNNDNPVGQFIEKLMKGDM